MIIAIKMFWSEGETCFGAPRANKVPPPQNFSFGIPVGAVGRDRDPASGRGRVGSDPAVSECRRPLAAGLWRQIQAHSLGTQWGVSQAAGHWHVTVTTRDDGGGPRRRRPPPPPPVRRRYAPLRKP